MFWGRTPRPSRRTIEEFERRRRTLEEARRGMKEEKRGKILGKFKRVGGEIRERIPTQRAFRKARFGIGERVGEFAGAGLRREEPFTREQESLKQMFGGGEKIWGWKNEPVEINNDLHPSLSGYDETASIFGFGGRI